MSSELVVRSLSPAVTAYLQLPGGWFLNNAGWVRGTERTLVVDTCATRARSEDLLTRARADSEPISAVLTHAHGDHSNGSGLVTQAGGEVLTSAAAATHVETGPQTFPGIFHCDTWGELHPATVTDHVTERRNIDLGHLRVVVAPCPTTAHTPGDLVVWCPREGVLFTGDLLFSGVAPLALDGSIRGWLQALDWLESFEPAHLVPGHGPIATDNGPITAVRDYLRWLLDVTGGSQEPDFAALHAQALQRWPDWHDSERHAVNLRVAHAETRGTSPQPEDLLNALLNATGGPIALDL